MTGWRRWSLAALLYLVCLSAATAGDIQRFFGSYVGSTTDISGDQEIRRDLGVEIGPAKDGFRLDWRTLSIRQDGRRKETRRSIEFFPSPRENIYTSAMRANVFGGRQPLDPMRGDPYVWARIQGDTLVVHALIITDDGGYEMLTYHRTLTRTGLHLVFDRVQNGVPQKRIEAELQRIRP